MARKTSKTHLTIPQSININIKLEAKPDTPFYYVNVFSVGHSAFDFTIGATRVPIPLSSEQTENAKRGETIVLEPTLQLIAAPWVVKNLIQNLTDQLNQYEQQFGKITMQLPTNGKK
jgi:hypothetical protein